MWLKHFGSTLSGFFLFQCSPHLTAGITEHTLLNSKFTFAFRFPRSFHFIFSRSAICISIFETNEHACNRIEKYNNEKCFVYIFAEQTFDMNLKAINQKFLVWISNNKQKSVGDILMNGLHQLSSISFCNVSLIELSVYLCNKRTKSNREK